MVDNWNPSFDMTDKAYIEKAELTVDAQISHVVDQITARAYKEATKKHRRYVNPQVKTDL